MSGSASDFFSTNVLDSRDQSSAIRLIDGGQARTGWLLRKEGSKICLTYKGVMDEGSVELKGVSMSSGEAEFKKAIEVCLDNIEYSKLWRNKQFISNKVGGVHPIAYESATVSAPVAASASTTAVISGGASSITPPLMPFRVVHVASSTTPSPSKVEKDFASSFYEKNGIFSASVFADPGQAHNRIFKVFPGADWLLRFSSTSPGSVSMTYAKTSSLGGNHARLTMLQESDGVFKVTTDLAGLDRSYIFSMEADKLNYFFSELNPIFKGKPEELEDCKASFEKTFREGVLDYLERFSLGTQQLKARGTELAMTGKSLGMYGPAL